MYCDVADHSGTKVCGACWDLSLCDGTVRSSLTWEVDYKVPWRGNMARILAKFPFKKHGLIAYGKGLGVILLMGTKIERSSSESCSTMLKVPAVLIALKLQSRVFWVWQWTKHWIPKPNLIVTAESDQRYVMSLLDQMTTWKGYLI